MPGFKGIEPGEMRKGELPREEMLSVDRAVKAGGFFPEAIQAGTDTYRLGRPEGLQNFIEIGERGTYGLFEPKSPSSIEFIPKERLGLRLWVDGIREFFARPLDHSPGGRNGADEVLGVLSYLASGESLQPMSKTEFENARNGLEENKAYPRTLRFFNLVTYKNGGSDFHDSWVSRGWVEVEESKIQVKVTTTAYGLEPGSLRPSIPGAPHQVEGYRIHAGTDAYTGGILVKTQDRALMAEIHKAFVRVYSMTGSHLAAFDWLLNKSHWANDGLFQWEN